MTRVSREFQVFAKPVGSNCNLACHYCYYLKKEKLYPGINSFRMTDEVLEQYIHLLVPHEVPIHGFTSPPDDTVI